MKQTNRRSYSDQINIPMAPMIDVVFLLLIFFITTYQEEIVETHMSVNLPLQNAQAATQVQPQLLHIHVMPGYYLLMGKQSITLDNLIDTLATFAKYDSDQTIVIKVSKHAKHKELITLLDHCKHLGLKKFNVLTLSEV